jgi:hypothetical protein
VESEMGRGTCSRSTCRAQWSGPRQRSANRFGAPGGPSRDAARLIGRHM